MAAQNPTPAIAEVGLIRFASVALEVAEVTLPRYRALRSEHVFMQPQHLAALCLMRFEGRTFREADLRIREHGELRQALRLERAPDYTTLHGSMGRLDERALHQALVKAARRVRGVVHEVSTPAAAATLAVDATGLSPGAISFYFLQLRHRQAGRPMPWQYLNWIMVVDPTRQVIPARLTGVGPCDDWALLRPPVSTAYEPMPMGAVLAYTEFGGERNYRHVREQVGGANAVKRGEATWHMKGRHSQMREAFPSASYRSRAVVETVFSAVKRKLSARTPCRTLIARYTLQAMLLSMACNVYRAIRGFAWAHRIN